MNAKAALITALLEGRVLNVNNCFKEIGLTNIGREIPRMVEWPFDVIVSRSRRNAKNRYGTPCQFIDYRLNRSVLNRPGIKLMEKYVKEVKEEYYLKNK